MNPTDPEPSMRLRTMRKDQRDAPWMGEGLRSDWPSGRHRVAWPVRRQPPLRPWWSLPQMPKLQSR